MKHTALFLAIMLIFTLTFAACSMNKPASSGSNAGSSTTNKPGNTNTNGTGSNGTNNTNNNGTNNGSSTDNKDNDTDIGLDTDTDTNTSGNNSSDTGANGSGTDNGTGNGSTSGNNGNTSDIRRFMYAGKLYTVTDEKVAQDKVGAELYSISSMVDGDPMEDGDAVGLDEGIRIFKLVEENEYRTVAVEIDNEFYLANMDEQAPANVG